MNGHRSATSSLTMVIDNKLGFLHAHKAKCEQPNKRKGKRDLRQLRQPTSSDEFEVSGSDILL